MRNVFVHTLIITCVVSCVGSLEGAQPPKPEGKFTDFDSLTTAAPATPVSSLPAPKAAPGTNTPAAKNDAAFVSNILALAVASTNSGPVGLNGYVPDDKYKLRVGDRVSFQIAEDRDPAKPLTVADSGELDVPYIGRVMAIDKTCKQLTEELKTQLEKEYYYRATVIVGLDSANKVLGKIYVWGQVKNQGPLELAVNENLTVGKAILRAGGFGDFANKKRVKVIRGAGANGSGKQTIELNLADILEKGQTEKDVVLQPDDSIIVPARLVNF